MSQTQIIRACGDSDKRCLFRAWSRLCLHAASLSASEGASAAATAAARAARAETVESNARMAEMLIAAAEKRTAGERSLREESDRRRAKQTVRGCSCYTHVNFEFSCLSLIVALTLYS